MKNICTGIIVKFSEFDNTANDCQQIQDYFNRTILYIFPTDLHKYLKNILPEMEVE